MTDVWIRWSLVMGGATVRYEVRPSAEPNPLPQGEPYPPVAYWWALYLRAPSDEQRIEIEQRADEAYWAYVRRPEPPPEGETYEQWVDRIIEQGEGWEARDVAMAERCTPRMVRKARIARERSPETGRLEGSFEHARELLGRGLTLRQVAMMTGISKSTLHREMAHAV